MHHRLAGRAAHHATEARQHRFRSATPRVGLSWALGSALLTLAAVTGCASGPVTVDLSEHPDPVARHFAGCGAFLAPDDGLIMECPERGLSMLVRAMPVPAQTVHTEMSASWPELADAAPLDALAPDVEHVVMRFSGESETPGARTEGLMAVADVSQGVTRLALCGQRPDADPTEPLDVDYCRQSLAMLVERGPDLPQALFVPMDNTSFVGRSLELDGLDCSGTEPGHVECADGSSLLWNVTSAERTAQMLADSPDLVTDHLLNRGAWKLDRQSPPCRIEDTQAECQAVRVAQGTDVVIVLFGRGTVRDEHVFVECSYRRDNAFPELDKNLPPVCAQILTLE